MTGSPKGAAAVEDFQQVLLNTLLNHIHVNPSNVTDISPAVLHN